MASSVAKAERGALRGARKPVELAVAGNGPPILAFHGFGASAFDMELLVEVASELGLAALAPNLPGHGTHVRELAQMRFGDWAGGVDSALARVEPPAIVAGLSLGSLLALDLALREPASVKALILLANAIRLATPFPGWGLELAVRLRFPDFLVPKRASDIGDLEARESQVTYSADPVLAASEVHRAGKRLFARLSEVRCPTLLIHGARDRVCPVSNAWRVAEQLGTDDVRVVVLPRSHHILTRDVEREVARREISQFVKRFL
jgi:carboxylesterase